VLIIIEYRESIAESNNNNASKINFYQKGKKSLTEREKNCDFVYFMGGGLEKKSFTCFLKIAADVKNDAYSCLLIIFNFSRML